jgi:hypothetical protein
MNSFKLIKITFGFPFLLIMWLSYIITLPFWFLVIILIYAENWESTI